MSKKKEYSHLEITALMAAFGKSQLTIKRWIESGNDMLTSKKAIDALKKIKTT